MFDGEFMNWEYAFEMFTTAEKLNFSRGIQAFRLLLFVNHCLLPIHYFKETSAGIALHYVDFPPRFLLRYFRLFFVMQKISELFKKILIFR